MLNRYSSARTDADSSTNDEVTTSSHTCTKRIVSGSASPGFLTNAVNIILKATPKPTYYTPKNVIDFINKNCIIANPPYNVKK